MAPLRYHFRTLEFSATDIHLRTLRDRQQYFDPDDRATERGVVPAHWALFGVLWEAAEVLAHALDRLNLEGLRILEVGCGIGLASLLAKQRNADITANDHHPLASEFLDYNCQLNNVPLIPFLHGDWADEVVDPHAFDLVIGSDLLYEDGHPALLAEFIHQHAKITSRVIIVDPGRGGAGRFCRHMRGHDFAHQRERAVPGDAPNETFAGYIHRFSRGN